MSGPLLLFLEYFILVGLFGVGEPTYANLSFENRLLGIFGAFIFFLMLFPIAMITAALGAYLFRSKAGLNL